MVANTWPEAMSIGDRISGTYSNQSMVLLKLDRRSDMWAAFVPLMFFLIALSCLRRAIKRAIGGNWAADLQMPIKSLSSP